MIKILMVEDREDLREFGRDELDIHDILVDEAPDFQTANEKLSHADYDAILLDLGLPDEDGIRLFDKHAAKLESKTIIITATPTIPSVVEAIKKGAFNYLEKPVDIQLLLAQIKKMLKIRHIEEENRSLKSQLSANFTFENMIYKSEVMAGVVSRARVLARTDNAVLIQGETGTGKEVIARALYNESVRSKKLFLPVNCAAIPAELFETELFGFEKGAFTGATDN
ncbi:MAG: sigma-54-dependent Fis family transcriptional regulator, partial [bacterium]|nr:sigma-54-dependent Fis family transcriptional regulator [bacterium]